MNYFKERIKVYFYINKVTKEKVDYMKKHVYINISFKEIILNIIISDILPLNNNLTRINV